MARLIRRIEAIVPKRAQGFGGKAKNLAALARAGFPVPAAFALPERVFSEFIEAVLPEGDRPAALLGAELEASTEERLAPLRARLIATEIPDPIARALTDGFERLRREGAEAIAVRSSSTHEDQEEASAAGIHETFLNVVSVEAMLDAVRRCFASVFTIPALTYLRTVGANDPSIGIVLQAMVPAEVSGVLFTINPLTGDPTELVINASYGLGCEVVDGSVSPDSLRIDKASGEPRDRILGDKAHRTVSHPEGGLRRERVPERDRQRLCLDEATVAELVALATRIETHFQDARDVEWALAGGNVYVLQARPISAAAQPTGARWPKRKRAPRGDRSKIVWSNVNVGEALPGVATPLTWSIAAGFSELGFRRAFGSLGCSVPKDAELVGNFRGRIYLNLTELMTVLSQVPGLRPRTLLALGGGGEGDRLEADIERRSPIRFLSRLPLTVWRFAQENYRINDRATAFERSFAAERRRIAGIDLRVLSPVALDHVLRDVERLLDEAGSLMLTCYGNLLSTMVLLRTVLGVVARDETESLQRELLSGLSEVDSAAPGLSLWHIAEMARLDGAARDRILDGDPARLRVSALPPGPTQRALDNFLAAHGHRGAREAEIAEPRWSEDPTLLFAALKIHLSRPSDGGPFAIERRQRAVRERAEAELARRMPAPARAAVRHLLAMVQRFLRLRERLRSHVVEVLGMFRRIALDASLRIEKNEPGAGDDAAFYLTLEELRAVLRRQTRSVEALVRQRRRQYERDRALPDPPDTFVGFPPPAQPLPPEGDTLRGLAASAGRAEGIARVIASPADVAGFRAGEILVASSADVGWGPLFLVAGALVTDLGGPLSHASIVLREYGVPAVVNVKVGTRLIRTGDRLLVNGDSGEVRILESAPSPSEVNGAVSERVDAGA